MKFSYQAKNLFNKITGVFARLRKSGNLLLIKQNESVIY